MGNAVRVGDNVSCGDHAAEGSANVFVNGMPISHEGKHKTTGHGCFPPTIFVGPFSSTVFVNGMPVTIKGKTSIMTHCCGKSCHGGVASSSSSNVHIEA